MGPVWVWLAEMHGNATRLQVYLSLVLQLHDYMYLQYYLQQPWFNLPQLPFLSVPTERWFIPWEDEVIPCSVALLFEPSFLAPAEGH